MMIVIATDSRQRMVRSAALLFREQGYSGTGFRDVIEHSGAPRGSIYHHFPGGKAELAAATVEWAGGVVERQIVRAGRPIVAVAVESEAGPGAVAAADHAFGRWQDLIAGTLRDAGVGRAEARRLATLSRRS